MDRAAPPRKLLAWPMFGASSRRPNNAFTKRLQAHAAIARSLSPFCTRTNLHSVRTPDSKCALALSAVLHGCACTCTALRDVHITTAIASPLLLSLEQQKAYVRAIRQHLLSTHQQSKPRHLRRIIKVSSCPEEECDRKAIHERPWLQHQGALFRRTGSRMVVGDGGHAQKHIKPACMAAASQEEDIKPARNKNCRQNHDLSLGRADNGGHNSHAKLIPTSRATDRKSSLRTEAPQKTTASAHKGKSVSPHNMVADVYLSTTRHVVEQHKLLFEEHYMKHPLPKYLHYQQTTRSGQHNPACKPAHRTHNRSGGSHKAYSHENEELISTSLRQASSLENHSSLHASFPANKTLPCHSHVSSTLRDSQRRLLTYQDVYVKVPHFSDPPLTAINVQHARGTVSPHRKRAKLLPISDRHNVGGGVWVQDAIPIAKYSCNPYADFYISMLGMLGRGVKDLHELENIFVCYILLNSSCNHKHIERAFRDILTDLCKCKMMASDELHHVTS